MSEADFLTKNFEFTVALKTLPQEGNLVYEYNPFFNYRLDRTMIYYLNRLMEVSEFCLIFNITEDDLKGLESWNDLNIPESESTPIVYQKGLLVDFETDLLDFSINNPVDIIPLWSYDNSVNLIINDGKNPPRLINSRFSATEKNLYQVCNRKGNNDTNIYDLGDQFDIDTSLYKKLTTIPRLKFAGVSYGGRLSIGNYFFYFRYVDEDGNESDFFAESGLVSIFIGNSADSIHSGFRNEDSHKLVKFILSNTDVSYSKVHIYYTRTTSDIFENATTLAYKILKEYPINYEGGTCLVISGYEETLEITTDEINATYQIYGSVETQDTALNMLFLANVDKPKTEYEDLADCALRFTPKLDISEIYDLNLIGVNYTGKVSNTYYDPYYIYNRVGYWDDEIYRFGIVFIKSDNTLTEVFNVRGKKQLNENPEYNSYTFKNTDGERVFINYLESTYNLIIEDKTSRDTITSEENSKGVVSIQYPDSSTIIGINFDVPEEVLEYLQNTLKIKGFFFVRLKRIPTTLCLAYTIGIDKLSHTPVLPVILSEEDSTKTSANKETSTNSESTNEETSNVTYITEGFLSNEDRYLVHDIDKRIIELENLQVQVTGAICPEYDVNSPYLNSLFSASELACRNCKDSNLLKQLEDAHLYFVPDYTFEKTDMYSTIKVIGVEDNVKLVAMNDYMFAARAGEAEEAFRFEYAGKKQAETEATNLIRGSYGPYLGITGYDKVGHLIDIKIPGYNPSFIDDYFTIRYNDKSPFYAISDRFDLENLDWWLKKGDTSSLLNSLYRGDCYICQFTHRLNRNFLDPSSPINDEIVDEKCWADNYEVKDEVILKEKFDKINLGDVNAVKLGMYITLTVRSTMNLNIRALDSSLVDEAALFGHERGFYPFLTMSNSGAYKIPEALCYNKGFEKSTSERTYFEVADVPWIKNEFSNRIAYSNIQVLDAFLNGWRTFIGTHYRDYPKTYGSITKIVELKGNLLCVFEHGVSLIPINERAVAGEGSGGTVYINTSNVLPENPRVISDMFGSLWKESIIKTPIGVYGVDTVAKKIWRTDGANFECISDFYVLEFLNNNISLTERELTPIIGIRNVKTHYNAYKKDVMFTFYDNLYGFEEKAWNLCYNESTKWTTFYSWIPSYSGNLYNLFYSFDRNTSKWIAKYGTSTTGSDFADGITVENPIIPETGGYETVISLSNRSLPENDGVTYSIDYSLERDSFGNYNKFKLTENSGKWILSVVIPEKQTYKDVYNSLCTELYKRDDITKKIITDERGRKVRLETPKNENKIVILLNIKATVKAVYEGSNATIGEAYAQGFTNGVEVNAGQYLSTIALIPEYNLQYLTTDFWKHGQAGIIDIADKILPTYWYGKQHPFEFEFVVANEPAAHKIFDNLEIISNNAEPESFHYEIIGDCYDFSKDKKNMYIRLEATKEFYQYNGSNITYNHNYTDLLEELRSLDNGYYDKSTLLPLYYSRLDTINEIEDYYHMKDGSASSKDYSALSGAEIVKYDNLEEYRIWNHAKAVDMTLKGRLRGNMQYKEDRWNVLINPINVVYKNEPKWGTLDITGATDLSDKKIPIELELSPIPSEVIENINERGLNIPENSKDRAIVKWNWDDSQMSEVKPKDKWIKIRIRYKGDKLAVITAITTLYSTSYS